MKSLREALQYCGDGELQQCTLTGHCLQVGCLAFELLAGRAPFEFESTEQTATAILHGRITAWPSTFQPNSIDFIKSCLQRV